MKKLLIGILVAVAVLVVGGIVTTKDVRTRFANEPDADAIIPTIEEELNNIAGTINRTIEMIEQDPEIQFCAVCCSFLPQASASEAL